MSSIYIWHHGSKYPFLSGFSRYLYGLWIRYDPYRHCYSINLSALSIKHQVYDVTLVKGSDRSEGAGGDFAQGEPIPRRVTGIRFIKWKIHAFYGALKRNIVSICYGNGILQINWRNDKGSVQFQRCFWIFYEQTAQAIRQILWMNDFFS